MFSSNSKFLDNILNNSINTHDNKTAFIVALNIANAVACKNALVIREYPIISTMLPTKEIIKNTNSTLLANFISEFDFHIFKYLKKNIKEIAEKTIFSP